MVPLRIGSRHDSATSAIVSVYWCLHSVLTKGGADLKMSLIYPREHPRITRSWGRRQFYGTAWSVRTRMVAFPTVSSVAVACHFPVKPT